MIFVLIFLFHDFCGGSWVTRTKDFWPSMFFQVKKNTDFQVPFAGRFWECICLYDVYIIHDIHMGLIYKTSFDIIYSDWLHEYKKGIWVSGKRKGNQKAMNISSEWVFLVIQDWSSWKTDLCTAIWVGTRSFGATAASEIRWVLVDMDDHGNWRVLSQCHHHHEKIM